MGRHLLIPELRMRGLVHAFSTRQAGEMRRTDAALLTPERRAFAAGLGLDPERMALAGAVHGAAVAAVEGRRGVVEATDGLVTSEPGQALFATFADCHPIVLFDPVRRVAGLAHAGWRGTADGIAARMVDALRDAYGCPPEGLVAGLGPGACGGCYEVGAEVAERFPGHVVQPRPGGRFLLDLAAANRSLLVSTGLRPGSVHEMGVCTIEDRRLPSHRRDADGSRFACIVALSRT